MNDGKKKSVFFWQLDIDIEGSKLVSKFLSQPSSLRVVYLNRNYIEASGMRGICQSLKFNKSITLLDLSHNIIGSEGVSHIRDCLLVNRALKSLILTNNFIKEEGGGHLSNILEESELEMLFVNHNQLGSSVSLISDSLAHNKKLKLFDLSFNFIGEKCANKFLKCLRTNQCLTQLFIYGNDFDDNIEQAMDKEVSLNFYLSQIHVRAKISLLILQKRNDGHPINKVPRRLLIYILSFLNLPPKSLPKPKKRCKKMKFH